MSPKLIAIHEYRFVRPEDVNPKTDKVLRGSEEAYAESIGCALAAMHRYASDNPESTFAKEAMHLEEKMRTAERTTLVMRKVA